MSAQDVVAAAIWLYEREIAGMPPADWATWSRRDPETAAIYACHAGSVLSGLHAAGLAVVPVEPTQAMLDAADELDLEIEPGETWAAMLAAAQGDAA
jgi:hypothetical protein